MIKDNSNDSIHQRNSNLKSCRRYFVSKASNNQTNGDEQIVKKKVAKFISSNNRNNKIPLNISLKKNLEMNSRSRESSLKRENQENMKSGGVNQSEVTETVVSNNQETIHEENNEQTSVDHQNNNQNKKGDWREIFYNQSKGSKESLDNKSANNSERNGTPISTIRRDSARNKTNLLQKTYAREFDNDKTTNLKAVRREDLDCSKYLLNQTELESSQVISSFDNKQENKFSDTKDSGGNVITSEKEILVSNKTTICSNPDDLTREKRFKNDTKEKKKYVLKTNNGKFMLSKKILNLNKDKTVEK